MFVDFEDDMLAKGEHVQHFIEMTNKLATLRAATPNTRFVRRNGMMHMRDIFFGDMQKAQFDRLIPVMRVEVITDEERTKAQHEVDPISRDLEFVESTVKSIQDHVVAHVSNTTVNDHIPVSPSSDKLFIWETGIKGLSVREITGMGWVMLQSGSYMPNRNRCIGHYWSGRDGAFGDLTRPPPNDPRYLNNQGGWMGTRQQILEWHTEQCPCGFLPPYDEPCYVLDGLDLRNVRQSVKSLSYRVLVHMFVTLHLFNVNLG